MSKRKKDAKKDGKKKDGKKKGRKAAVAARATTAVSPRMVSEQKESVVVTAEDGSPLFVVRNVLLNTQCPDVYAEGSLALFGTYTVVEPKA